MIDVRAGVGRNGGVRGCAQGPGSALVGRRDLARALAIALAWLLAGCARGDSRLTLALAILPSELEAYRDDAVLSERALDELIGRLSGRAGFARLESGLAPRNLRSSIVARSKDAARVEAAAGERVVIADVPASSLAAGTYEIRVKDGDEPLGFLKLEVRR